MNAMPGSATGSDGRVLTSGYYQLTLVTAAFLAAAEIRLAAPSLPSISLLEVVLIPAFLCLVIEILCRPMLRARARILYRQNRPLVWYGGYAALASFAGLARSRDTLQSFHDLFVALALYMLVCLTIDDYARLRGLLVAALAGAMVNIALGLLQVGAGGPYLIPLSQNIDAKLDLAGDTAAQLPTGMFNHPNGLALFLLPVVIFLLVGAFVGARDWFRRGLPMVALLAPAALVLQLTLAKGAYAWLAVGAMFIVLPRKLDRHRAWLAVATVVGGIVGLTWYSLQAFLEGDLVLGTIVSRIELWVATWNILQSDPFVVVFGGGGAQLAGQTLITFEYKNAHNAWLDQALTYGVPALVFYLGAYLVAFRSLTRRIQFEPRPIRTVALATFASLVAILGESFFEPANHGVVLQAQLFLLLAIAAVVATPAFLQRPLEPCPQP